MLTHFILFVDIAAGYHLHGRRSLIEKMKAGKHVPYLFHVNWLPGNMKKPTLEATKNWYVHSLCAGKQPHELTNMTGGIYDGCCMDTHYTVQEKA
jgi:hypothetical protein